MAPGLPPKRDSQRRRRSPKAQNVHVDALVTQPDPPAAWCALAKDWYRSLAQSGQAVFYEPSDWATAIVAGWCLDEWNNTRKAATITEFRHLCSQLMVTEGDRRRGRLEVKRPGQGEDSPKGNAAVAEYRAALGVVRGA
jgi:hypothetical protein